MKSADIIKQNPSVIPTAAKASTTEESSEKLESDNLPRGGAVQPESIVKITPSRPQLVTMVSQTRSLKVKLCFFRKNVLCQILLEQRLTKEKQLG